MNSKGAVELCARCKGMMAFFKPYWFKDEIYHSSCLEEMKKSLEEVFKP